MFTNSYEGNFIVKILSVIWYKIIQVTPHFLVVLRTVCWTCTCYLYQWYPGLFT
jgi:hypothetical protein